MNQKILVIGAGAWGTSIANLIAKNSFDVVISANNKNIVEEINQKNSNQKYLAKVKLSENLRAVKGLLEKDVKEASLVFIVTPSQTVEKILKKIASFKPSSKVGFVICSKGLDHQKLRFFSDIFESVLKRRKFAILSGPNFALEVAMEVPTVTTIASKDKKLGKKVMAVLKNDYFTPEFSKDPITTEICGVVKNIIAIGCGIVDGLNLGQNAKAALINKGISEIMQLCKKLKGKGDLNNPAGFGDIFLTCSSLKSRNNSLGYEIAQGKAYAQINQESGKVFEGAVSAKSIVKLSQKLKIRLILCETINEIVHKKLSASQIKSKITEAILAK